MSEEMVTVIVIKPFVFSRPVAAAKAGVTAVLPHEKRFVPNKSKETGAWEPTEMQMPADIYADPWISVGFADGAIESPTVTQQRLQVVADRAAAQAKENDRQNKLAEAALARAQGKTNLTAPPAVDDAQLEKDLNTPINELVRAAGTDVDKAPAPKGKKA